MRWLVGIFPTVHRAGATPVPIPNTEVKPCFGDGTAGFPGGRVARRWDLSWRRRSRRSAPPFFVRAPIDAPEYRSMSGARSGLQAPQAGRLSFRCKKGRKPPDGRSNCRPRGGARYSPPRVRRQRVAPRAQRRHDLRISRVPPEIFRTAASAIRPTRGSSSRGSRSVQRAAMSRRFERGIRLRS